MRLTTLNFVSAGSPLAQDILSPDGRIWLRKGTKLSSSYINKLTNLGYTSVAIDDELTYDIDVEGYIPPDTRNKVFREVKNTFNLMKATNRVSQLIPYQATRKFMDTFNDLLDFIKGNSLFSTHMGGILFKDGALYSHSLNVGFYSTIIAISKGYNDKKARDLGVGALLHDIGKITIPESILNKPGKLDPDEWDQILQHPTVGYDILRKQTDFSLLSAHCAYQHHEKYDGTGYPRGLKGKDIHEVGRIIAVADVYDALTTARPYKKAFLPSEAIEYLFAHSGTHFDPEFVLAFRDNIAIYPAGVTVILSDHRKGVVVRNNPNSLQRPVVRVFSEEGRSISPYEIDLSLPDNLRIGILECTLDIRPGTECLQEIS